MQKTHISCCFKFCLVFCWFLSASVQAADADVSAAQAQYHVLAAEVAGQRGQPQLAAQEYIQALRLMPSLELAERATQVCAFSGNASLALEAASLWAELDPERLEPHVVLMRVAVTMEQVPAAIEHALFIVDKHPKSENQAFMDISQSLSTDTGHVDAALAVMQGLREEYEDEAQLEYATGLLALKLGAAQPALDAANLALDLEEDWAEAILLKVTALMGLDQVEQAVDTVNNADLADSQQIKLHLAFARLLLQEEQGAPAVGQYQKALALNDEQAEALYALGVLQLNLGDEDAAFGYFKTLYEKVAAKRNIAAYFLGGIEENRDRLPEALAWYEVVEGGDRYLDASQRKAFVLYKLGKLDEARDGLRELRASNPDMAVQFYLTEGELLYQARQLEQAMGIYNEGLENFPDEIDLLYGRSLIAERMGRFTLSEQDLRRILELEPEDPRSLNALGYILANHTRRYKEALQLITRALELTPEDPAVIDSMGWVQYRMGNNDAALEHLSKAYDRMPDPEVAAHLGEVLWKMGREKQAQELLEQAFSDDSDNPVLRDTIKRLIR